MNTDITALYQQAIRDHSRNPQHLRHQDNATITRRMDNAACGDWVEIALLVEEGVIMEAAFTGEGCALAIASADIMCEMITGMKMEEASLLTQDFLAALDGDEAAIGRIGEGPAGPLLAARAFPGRIGCVRLGWGIYS